MDAVVQVIPLPCPIERLKQMCQWGTDAEIHVIRRNNDFIPDGWHPVYVDACIADYVQTMNLRGIITVGCCCGHGKSAFAAVLVDMASISLLERYGYEYHDFDDRPDVVEHLFTYPALSKG